MATDLLYAVSNGIAVLTLNRPATRNALTREMLEQLSDALEEADGSAAVKAVVVTGAGDSFCAGADLSMGLDGVHHLLELDQSAHARKGYREPLGRVTSRLLLMTKPVIGAVNGDAIGGGASLLTAMDVRLAASEARFGFVFTRLGLTPEGISSWLLPKVVGLPQALDWMLSGRLFTADEAATARFVRLVPSEQPSVLSAACEYAERMTSATSRAAVAATRRLLWDLTAKGSVEQAALIESAVLRRTMRTADAIEGIESFLEGRRPNFSE